MVTAFPDNDLGRLAEDLIRQGGVDVSHVIWREYDGVGRNTRLGLNFTERGFGVRPPKGVSDRGHSAAAQMAPGEVDWDRLFGEVGVRWLHTGGVFAALSPEAPHVILEAVKSARRHGTVVSYDLNYRASLWNAVDDPGELQRLGREIAAHVDVMFGDARGFKTCLGYDAPSDFTAFAQAAVRDFPSFRVLAATDRKIHSATRHDWGAVLWADGAVHTAPTREELEILDRVGGGDAFAAGVVYALMEGLGPQAAVDYGAASGALAMTTPGDASMADLAQVEALVKGASGKVIR